MSGGVAVRANLLCVTWSAAQGHVFLFDIEARERVSAWSMPTGSTGYSDAAGVAMDENFHLYVADPHNQRVRHFSVFGRHLGDFGRALPATGDVGRDRAGVLEHPRAVAVHGRTLVVAGGERPRRFAVQRFDRSGNALTPLHSGGDPEAEFSAPHAVYADSAGILVADTLAGCVQRFRPDGAFVASVPCAPRGHLARPTAVVRRADGSLLLVDRGDDHGLRAVGADGRALPVPGDLPARCRDVVALAVDETSRLYVLDHHGERVVRFDTELAFDDVLVDLAEHLDDYEPGRSDS
ncbi:MAG: NHL repeat-containing protein [bacterium]|nr:NHL repeat-containing protein [bacterium]